MDAYFNSNLVREFSSEDIDEHFEESFAKILSSIEKFVKKGSGFVLKKYISF